MYHIYFKLMFIVFCGTFVSSCASVVRPGYSQEISDFKAGSYNIDPNHASLIFRVNHLGFSDFIGRFNQFEAALEFDPENVAASKVIAQVDMRSLDLVNNSFEKTLKTKKWLDVEAFPKAEFESTHLVFQKGSDLKFAGILRFRGVERPVELDVSLNGAANNLLTQRYTLGFSAKLSFSRSEFGLSRYDALVGDRVSIEVDAEFFKR